MSLAFVIVDVLTDTPLPGNQLAVFEDGSSLASRPPLSCPLPVIQSLAQRSSSGEAWQLTSVQLETAATGAGSLRGAR